MRILKSTILIICCIGLVSITSQAQKLKMTKAEEVGLSSERLKRITPHFQKYIDENKIAGIQTLVARKGGVAHFESNGYADIEGKNKIDKNTIFRIYSMSKPITSVATMILLEEGKLLLNDRVDKYIPEFKDLVAVVKDDKSGVTKPLSRPMRIVDLMSQSSGLGYGWGYGSYVDSLYRLQGIWKSKNLEEFSKTVAGVPLYFEPGTAWRYGISTDILGRVVEVASGQSLDQFFQERIFEPLKMKDTFFEVPKKKSKRFATCYKPTKDYQNIEVQDHPSSSRFAKEVTMFSGGGGLLSTTQDYYRFCQMLLNGGFLDGKRIMSPKSIELMTQDHVSDLEHQGGPVRYPNKAEGFGLGFSVTKNLAETNQLGSEGSYGWGGAAGTYFRIDPKEKMIIIQMIQLMPYNHLQHQTEFHNLVYQAIFE